MWWLAFERPPLSRKVKLQGRAGSGAPGLSDLSPSKIQGSFAVTTSSTPALSNLCHRRQDVYWSTTEQSRLPCQWWPKAIIKFRFWSATWPPSGAHLRPLPRAPVCAAFERQTVELPRRPAALWDTLARRSHKLECPTPTRSMTGDVLRRVSLM